MTAEIAILNRRAVALSADSAVTISHTGKIYNSADKIFELSSTNPIGLMVYNSLDYMGMPLDVLIKSFRESRRDGVHFNNVFDAATAFLDFLRSEFPITEEMENSNIDGILFDEFQGLPNRIIERVGREFVSGGWKRVRGKGRSITLNFDAVFASVIDDRIATLSSIAANPGLADIPLQDLGDRFKSVVNDLIREFIPASILNITDEVQKKLYGLAALVLRCGRFSENHTGFVFAGYGDRQLFPSLISYRFDGMIMSRLKLEERDRVEIDSQNSRARIIPFAQREMVDRFLYGIDQSHERAILHSIRQNVNDLKMALLESLKGVSRSKRDTISKSLEEAATTLLDDLQSKTMRELKNASETDSLDAVSVMTKPDLANFAEALVNITSVKRRASLETETVGGPIDVAVISRDDGFVWVKRKHYFDKDLNPRFFHRKYGTTQVPKEDRHGEA